MRMSFVFSLVAIFGFAGGIHAQCPNSSSHTAMTSVTVAKQDSRKVEKDIVETAVGAEGFSLLVAAVKAGGLVEVLQGEGPFTVFAPTDEAFKALPEGTLESLLKPENKDQLVAILTYHVVAGDVRAADVVKLEEAKTVQGQVVKIKVKEGKVHINDATVIKADIACKNGVIHVIDKVILPPTDK